jgi:hypothetical protein
MLADVGDPDWWLASCRALPVGAGLPARQREQSARSPLEHSRPIDQTVMALAAVVARPPDSTRASTAMPIWAGLDGGVAVVLAARSALHSTIRGGRGMSCSRVGDMRPARQGQPRRQLPRLREGLTEALTVTRLGVTG